MKVALNGTGMALKAARVCLEERVEWRAVVSE